MHDNEWLKILTSALVGMLIGLIAEPIRGAITKKIELFKMRRAIGLDLLTLIIARENVKHEVVPIHNFWQYEMFPSFAYYWERNREYFYTDFTWQEIRLGVQTIQYLQDGVKSGVTNADEAEAKLSPMIEGLKKNLWTTRMSQLEMLKRKMLSKLS